MTIIETQKARKYMKLLAALSIGGAVVLFPMYRYYIVGALVAKKIMAKKQDSKIVLVKRGGRIGSVGRVI